MVIVKIVGGLGNQLFQYAAGRQIALLKNVPLKLDVSSYKNDPLRTYDLQYFNIVAEIASPMEIAHLKGWAEQGGLKGRLAQAWQKFKPYYQRSYIHQKEAGFDPNIFQVAREVYLYGHWHSEKYFKGIEELIRHEFTLKTKPEQANKTMAEQIAGCCSVSLHVRRGDYVSNPETNRLHGVCSLEYYMSAVALLTQSVHAPHFFIFSDDPSWVQENLHLPYPTTYVTHNGPDKSYEDLRLLSLCQHHIIANSSFSWWGAWLSSYPQKIVIAPKKWFNESQFDPTDFIPASWQSI